MVKYERRLFNRNTDNSTIPEMKIISILLPKNFSRYIQISILLRLKKIISMNLSFERNTDNSTTREMKIISILLPKNFSRYIYLDLFTQIEKNNFSSMNLSFLRKSYEKYERRLFNRNTDNSTTREMKIISILLPKNFSIL